MGPQSHGLILASARRLLRPGFLIGAQDGAGLLDRRRHNCF